MYVMVLEHLSLTTHKGKNDLFAFFMSFQF